MKTIAAILTTATIASASMCNFYYDRMIEANKDAYKASQEGMMGQAKMQTRFSLRYAKKTIIKCNEGSKRYENAKALKEQIENY